MPNNPVMLHIDGEPWTLGALCLIAAPVVFVLSIFLVVFTAKRWGTTRALSASEAAQVAMNPAEPSYVDRQVPIHGPAMGREWRVDYSASDLREAWRARDYAKFFGLPAMSLLGVSAGELLCFGIYLLGGQKAWMFWLLPNFVLTPIALAPLFLMWAAIYTKLE